MADIKYNISSLVACAEKIKQSGANLEGIATAMYNSINNENTWFNKDGKQAALNKAKRVVNIGTDVQNLGIAIINMTELIKQNQSVDEQTIINELSQYLSVSQLNYYKSKGTYKAVQYSYKEAVELPEPKNSGLFEYIGDSLNCIIKGDYAEDFTLLGCIGNILVGCTPIGWLADARDLLHAVTHTEENGFWGSALAIGVGIVAFVPIVGDVVKTAVKPLKYADEVADGMKVVGKIVDSADDIGDGAKVVGKVADATDDIGDGAKVTNKVLDKSDDVIGGVVGKENDIIDSANDIGKNVDEASDVVENSVVKKVAGKTEEGVESGIPTVKKVFTDNPFDENGNLKSNIKYQTGEFKYNYETDANGRISNWNTDNLQLTEREGRLNYNADTPGKEAGDHAGHLAGDRFGGSPELDNIVSQSQNVNLSEYKKIENQWANAISEGKEVTVNVDIKYDGDGLRPIEFNVEYTVDGDFFSQSILN